MENYKKTIKKRITLCYGVLLLAVIVGVLDVFGVTQNIFGDLYNESLAGFQEGLLIGFGIIAFYLAIRYHQCLRDEKKLQFLLNSENDERKSFIKGKAGQPMLMITSFIMIFVAIIAGYFNELIFLTLIAAAMGQLTISCIVKIYYMKRM